MGEEQIQSTGSVEPASATSIQTVEPVKEASTTEAQNQGEPAKASPDQATEPAKASEPGQQKENQPAEEEVPPKRISEFQKYMTQKTQELSKTRQDIEQQKQKIEAYDRFMATEYQNYLAWRQEQQVQQPVITPDEIEAMQLDPARIPDVVNKLVDAKVKTIQEQVARVQQESAYKESVTQKKEEIMQVAEMFPDFWELYDEGTLKLRVQEIADSGKGTIVDAYNAAKQDQDRFLQKAMSKVQGRVQEKKSSVTASPTPSGTPEIIFAADRQEASKIAFENAILGKKVDVRIRK